MRNARAGQDRGAVAVRQTRIWADNGGMADRVIMTRLTRGRAPGREFDIAFWQALGPTRIFEAAWDLVVTAAAAKGIHEDQLRLQRSVTKLIKRGRRRTPPAE